MRIYRLAHALISRFGAMDETEATDLNLEAQKSYNDAVDAAKYKIKWNNEAQEFNAKGVPDPLEVGAAGELVDVATKKPPVFRKREYRKLTIADNAVLLCEKWWARYVFGILYIIMVPAIKDYMNGGSEDQPDGDQEDFEEMMRFMKAYSRMKSRG